jgi:hypothetical protein
MSDCKHEWLNIGVDHNVFSCVRCKCIANENTLNGYGKRIEELEAYKSMIFLIAELPCLTNVVKHEPECTSEIGYCVTCGARELIKKLEEE